MLNGVNEVVQQKYLGKPIIVQFLGLHGAKVIIHPKNKYQISARCRQPLKINAFKPGHLDRHFEIYEVLCCTYKMLNLAVGPLHAL